MFLPKQFDRWFVKFLKITSLRSTVFSDYFHILMNNNNIKSIRNGIKVFVIYFASEVITSHMAERGSNFRCYLALGSLLVYLIIYISTLHVTQAKVMLKLASIMSVLSMIYTVLMTSDQHEIVEIHYSLCIILILGMYTLYRLNFLTAMLLSVIYVLLTLTLTNNRLLFLRTGNDTEEIRNNSFDKLRVIHGKFENRKSFLFGQFLLLVSVYLTGFYLRFFNSIRRKAAFLKLIQNAESKVKMNSAVQLQLYWIEAIMPGSVKNEFLERIGKGNQDDLIYCQKFEDVSILFSDIAGFTSMSSNKSAEQIVFLLNDLYNRFDEYCEKVLCEKLGTLGDCYYCVSGCPTPTRHHAMNCVEMGLGMCRLIGEFNQDHQENVNMRVGVHSGKVIAAIIGNHRFRFDVFSYDVFIANDLESSGKPGQVHISDSTYNLVAHNYTIIDGEEMKVKTELDHGISGSVQTIKMIKTYFVVNDGRKTTMHSSRSNLESISVSKMNKNLSNIYTKSSVIKSDDENYIENSMDIKGQKIKHEIDLVKMLQSDPDKPTKYYENPPLNTMTLFFTDKEVEYHYLHHTIDQVKKVDIDSIKFALMFDCIACFLYTFNLVCVSYLLVNEPEFNIYSIVIASTGLIITICCIWTSLVYRSQIKFEFMKNIYSVLAHPLAKMLMSIYISSMPSIMISTLGHQDMYKTYSLSAGYFTLILFALIGNCIYSASYSVVKNFATLANTVSAITMVMIRSTDEVSLDFSSCTDMLKTYLNLSVGRLQYNFIYQFLHVSLLVYFLNRETEKNIRIYFYISREAEILKDEAKQARRVAESLLYNIIPRHVFAIIKNNMGNNRSDMNFSYAQSVPNVGVCFACIHDFLYSFYAENYRNGEISLKILHSIICRFDNLLRKPIYTDLEKIKTINDCYMLASGLNQTKNPINSTNHLIQLLKYAMELKRDLAEFNKEMMIGQFNFQLKIGYNFGPITAGIIGTRKPLYDIWGDTVNVASRMYSTAPLDSIQVSTSVRDKLHPYFHFIHRGKVFMKGKGEVDTYLAQNFIAGSTS